MCVYICVYTYVCVYVCVCIHIFKYFYDKYIFIYILTYVYNINTKKRNSPYIFCRIYLVYIYIYIFVFVCVLSKTGPNLSVCCFSFSSVKQATVFFHRQKYPPKFEICGQGRSLPNCRLLWCSTRTLN